MRAFDQTVRATDALILENVGNYRLESKLAEGGMGVVYKATQLGLDRTVARR